MGLPVGPALPVASRLGPPARVRIQVPSHNLALSESGPASGLSSFFDRDLSASAFNLNTPCHARAAE